MLVSWEVLAAAVIVLTVACAAALVAVVVIKAIRHRREQRQRGFDAVVRKRVMTLAVAEGDELDALVHDLASTTGAVGTHVEETLLRMVPEVRGEVREAMVRVLDERGLLQKSLARINSSSAIQRAGAGELLGILGGPEVVRPLTRALKDKSTEVRLVAARALGVAARPEAGGYLVDALAMDSGVPHSVAATALLSLPDPDPYLFIEGLQDADPGIRYGSAAVVGLLMMSDASEALLECLVRELNRKGASDVVIAACSRSLGRLGHKPATQMLAELACAADASGTVRRAAGEALKNMPGVEAREIRQQVVLRADADVRRILVDG